MRTTLNELRDWLLCFQVTGTLLFSVTTFLSKYECISIFQKETSRLKMLMYSFHCCALLWNCGTTIL